MQNEARGGRFARSTVFSDYVCSFCYLEGSDLARVREQYGDAIEVDWRAFEISRTPSRPSTRTAITSTACGTPPSTRWQTLWV